MPVKLGGSAAAAVDQNDIRYWPYQVGTAGSTQILTNANQSFSSGWSGNYATFWTKYSQWGAVNTQSKDANTWYTWLDATGDGLLGTFVMPMANNNSVCSHDIRITTGGETYERHLTGTYTQYGESNRRITLGAEYNTLGSAADGRIAYLQGKGIDQFVSITHEHKYTGGVNIMSIENKIVSGAPVMRFRGGIKVEAKQSQPTSQNYWRNGGCQYLLFPAST